MAEEEEEPKVGYKNPPVATRFKPGQSGNPSGKRRKKPPKTMEEAMEAILSRRIEIIKCGKRVKMSYGEALCEKAFSLALAGDTRLIMKLMPDLKGVGKSATHNSALEISEHEEQLIERYVARRISAAQTDGGDDE